MNLFDELAKMEKPTEDKKPVDDLIAFLKQECKNVKVGVDVVSPTTRTRKKK